MTIRRAALADAGAISHVIIDSWRATYRGIVPDAYLAAMSYEANTERWERSLSSDDPYRCRFVAEDDAGLVAGIACGGPERDKTHGIDGELYLIYLRDEVKGLGIGRKLLQAVARSLTECGMTGMLIWVLADNPSRGFYEACGGVEVARKMIEIGGAELEEIGYGWRDLETMRYEI